MNWYRTAQIAGEWWIVNGAAVFADGDIGDYNHSGVVIGQILAEHDLTETVDISKENRESMKSKGLSDDEIAVVFDQKDPREYAMQYWGWKRVNGNNVQTQTLTEEDLKDISKGLWEIRDDMSDDEKINIEVVGNRTYYHGVPYRIINSNDANEILPFRRAY